MRRGPLYRGDDLGRHLNSTLNRTQLILRFSGTPPSTSFGFSKHPVLPPSPPPRRAFKPNLESRLQPKRPVNIFTPPKPEVAALQTIRADPPPPPSPYFCCALRVREREGKKRRVGAKIRSNPAASAAAASNISRRAAAVVGAWLRSLVPV